jgi:hypothetical protein
MLADLFLLCFWILPLLAAASPIESSFNSTLTQFDTLTSGNSTEAKVVTGLSIIGGLFLAFAGYRLFKATLFLVGFIAFADIAYWILVRVEPQTGYANRNLMMLLVPIGAGIIGGLIAFKLFKFGLSLIGALGGATLAIIILSMKNNSLIETDTGRILFVLGMALIGGILIHFVERPAIIVSTSLLGSFTTFVGIDSIAKTGFAHTVQLFLFGGVQLSSLNTYTASGGVIGMIVGTLILTAISAASQFQINKNFSHRKG